MMQASALIKKLAYYITALLLGACSANQVRILLAD